MGSNRQTLFLILFSISIFIIVPSVVQAESYEDYIVIAEHDIDEPSFPPDVIIKDTFDSFNGYLISATSATITKLSDSKEFTLIQKDQHYQIQSQVTPWVFEEVGITPEINSAFDGKDVKVGIVDTGIDYDHPDLNVAGGVCTVPDGKLYICPKTVPYDDDNYHGTHVAGTVAALNNAYGTVGIAPAVELYAIKVLNKNGAGTTTSIIKGIEWAIKNELDILNLSLTTNFDDAALAYVLNEAYNEGILLVGAAGNIGGSPSDDVSNVMYPARYETVIAVGGSDREHKKMSQSSTGVEVEITAPGSSIYSSVPIGKGVFLDENGYTTQSGTSMAAAQITGILALYKSAYPEFNHIQLRNILTSTAKDLGETGRDSEYGFGLAQFIENPIMYPAISLKSIEKGKIEFTVLHQELIKSVSINRGKVNIYTGIPKDQYEDYVPAGSYDYDITWILKDDTKINKVFSIISASPSFPDLSINHWYAPHMTYLFNKEIISGYLDNTIRPNTLIKRGEAVALLGRALGLNGEKINTRFSDVSQQNFASGYIQDAYENKLLLGFSDGSFRPDQYVTRAEMAILIANAYELKITTDFDNPFQDVTSSVTGHEEIFALLDNNITNGVTEVAYGPYDHISRYAFSVFIARAENPYFKRD